jgi:hypothetical protein
MSRRSFFPLLCTLVFSFVASMRAQSFSVTPSTVTVAALPGMNHVPLRLPIAYSPASYDLSKIAASSDASWVTPSIDASDGTLVLTFGTSSLVKRTYTATISLNDGTRTAQVFVQAVVSPLNVVTLKADPTRARVYGVQQDGVNAGALVIYDPIQQAYVGNLTLGNKPSGLAISADGSEALVICGASQSIMAVDLNALKVRETITLPSYLEWGVDSTSAHVGYGAGNVLYYTDGAWAPNLYVFDRGTRKVLQTVLIDSNGFGDFVVSPDRTSLFGWAQYGWSAGWLGCYVAKYSIGPTGTLTFQTSTSSSYPTVLNRDPLNTPALISADNKTVIIKQLAVSAANINTVVQSTPTPIFAISPNAEILSTQSAIFSLATGNKLFDLPVTSTVQAITWDYSRLVFFDGTAKSLSTVDLTRSLSLSSLGLGRTPADQSIVLPPSQLQWAPILGVSRYRVYLGTSQAAVSQATTSSAEFLGESTTPSLALSRTLVPGQTYYWRVDLVTANDVVAGAIVSFKVSSVATDVSAITAATVQAQKDFPVAINLTSAAGAVNWSATASAPWIGFVASSGVTPSTLQVRLDATALKSGLNQGSITVTTSDGSFSIPVNLTAEPLALTVMRSDPLSTKVYAISEGTTGNSHAYLVEIDSLLQRVTRVVPVGSSATDLAISHGDNRIYVPNWRPGGLLGVNLTTFQVETTFATAPFGGTGYGAGDVFRMSAGVAGRLVTEEEDQWIDITLFNTATGKALGTSGQREGGGQFEPTGRYYYHGDDNDSGAALHKLDTVADKFSEVGNISITGASYYGSRTVVVSDDGSRIFWNGGAFDPALKVVWIIGDEIYSATPNGRYAFGKSKIYDTERKQSIGTMPVTTSVSAYNGATGRLVVQNGSQLGFYTLYGSGLLGDKLAPKDGAIGPLPSQLTWTAIPGVDSYRVYFGTSLSAVNQADPSSTAYIGSFSTPGVALPAGLVSGVTYFWRVDVIVGGEIVGTQTQSFVVSPVVPDVSQINTLTVQGDSSKAVSVSLSSASAGLAWTASSPDGWVKFSASSGVTPGTVQVLLDASQLSSGTSTSSVIISGAWGSFTLPVTLQVDPLALTLLRSDPQSSKVYGISEAAGTAHAYLIEIDSAAEKITRTVPVGSSATDLAIHHGDNRIYVPNWIPGGLMAVNMNTFVVDTIFPTPPYGPYGENDVYRVSAGVAGRLLVEAEDQWINISIFDTTTGNTLASSFQREGAGQFEPNGRYYYHGDNNISNASLHKLDTLADKFTEVAKARPTGFNGYGSRSVVVTEDGSRIFWSGMAFDAALGTVWNQPDEIYAANRDGSLAASSTKIYDVSQRKAIYGLPSGTARAFNSLTKKIVLQNGQRVACYTVDPSVPLPAPVLSTGTPTTSAIGLTWAIDALQTGFTLQMRPTGGSAWTDVSTTLARSLASYTVTGLSAQTSYDFRIKADAGTGSGWSNIVTLSTLFNPPAIAQQPSNQSAAAGGSISLTASLPSGTVANYQWYRNGETLPDATDATLRIDNVQPANAGIYTGVLSNPAGTLTSRPAIVGVSSASKVIGAGYEAEANVTHPNGNTYDQVLVTGAAETITAEAGQITRTSFIDLNDDIVQVEFTGAGTLSLVLDASSGPAQPASYHQPSVEYMKGHAGIVITGANETTNVSIFTVGRATAFDPTGAFNMLLPIGPTNNPASNGSPLFAGHEATDYDGIADIAYIAIASVNGKFGGLRAADAACFATNGFTGVYAPGVQFAGPVYLHDIDATGAAKPVFIIGSSPDTRITGGNLHQSNSQPVAVSGLARLQFTAGSNSGGTTIAAQPNQGRLEENGIDVTNRVTVNPSQ